MELVSHALLLDGHVCKLLLLGLRSCSKSCLARMHSIVFDLRRWTPARVADQDTFQVTCYCALNCLTCQQRTLRSLVRESLAAEV